MITATKLPSILIFNSIVIVFSNSYRTKVDPSGGTNRRRDAAMREPMLGSVARQNVTLAGYFRCDLGSIKNWVHLFFAERRGVTRALALVVTTDLLNEAAARQLRVAFII